MGPFYYFVLFASLCGFLYGCFALAGGSHGFGGSVMISCSITFGASLICIALDELKGKGDSDHDEQ